MPKGENKREGLIRVVEQIGANDVEKLDYEEK